jgi:hypothetical protein
MPTRGQRIARAKGRSYDKLRSIFLSDVCLRVLSGDQNNWTTEATYDSHWYLDRHEYSDLVAGKRYKLLKVADAEGCRLPKLRIATAVEIGNPTVGWERFKVAVKPTTLHGMVPDYELKLSPTGERV